MEVRNTIRNIDQTAYHDAKIFAALTQQSLGDLISETLRNHIYALETIEMVEGWLDDTLEAIDPDDVESLKEKWRE